MNSSTKNRHLKKILVPGILLVVFCLGNLFAQQLPVKQFSVVDGLAENSVTQICADSRGFMWFPTLDGLSRFDGYKFTTYSEKHGLPGNYVTGIFEEKRGIYWVATFSGLVRVNFDSPLDADGKLDLEIIDLNKTVKIDQIVQIYRNGKDQILAATNLGLFRVTENSPGKFNVKKISLDFKGQTEKNIVIKSVVADEADNLWIGTNVGLLRRKKDESVQLLDLEAEVIPAAVAGNSIRDKSGLLWFCSLRGIYVIKPHAGSEPLRKIKRRKGEIKLPENAGEYTHFTYEDGIAADMTAGHKPDTVFDVFQTSAGEIWFATNKGLTIFDGVTLKNYDEKNNLSSDPYSHVGEDLAGNIWLSKQGQGLMRIANSGLESFTDAHGLQSKDVGSVFGGKDGEVYANAGLGNSYLSRYNGRSFDTIHPNFPTSLKNFGWAGHQGVLQKSNGEWWFPTGEGVFRFPAVAFEELANVQPIEVFNMADGLPSEEIHRLYEDRSDDVWISLILQPARGLARWRNATGELQIFSEKDLGFDEMKSAKSFAEDKNGDLWIIFNGGQIVRVSGEKIQNFADKDLFGETLFTDLLFDKNGTLWITSDDGVFLTKNPAADKPLFEKFEKDFARGYTKGIIDDRDGNLYFGTKNGITRFDPNSGRTSDFTTADGLAGTFLHSTFRDEKGILWFGTVSGLTRLDPSKANEKIKPPTILIGSIKAGGEQIPLPELGATNVPEIILQSNQSNIEIEVIGLTQKSGDVLQYQYKLRDADDWSEPTTQRVYNFANLKSGGYNFEIRVKNSAGLLSENTATVSFSILAPFYMRWWFIALATSIIGIALYLLYRYRLKRLLEIERIRFNIATDLHDDIGSSLSQISLISEVLATKQNGFHDKEKRSLETIAETSRSAVSSMSEMVWAINPKRDNLRDLIFRMRRFAGETLEAAAIKYTFRTGDFEENIRIEPDTRRHIYMIFKESINNAVKHSECSNVTIEFSKDSKDFILQIKDDGKGFDLLNETNGNGLSNMKSRAKNIGGEIEIICESGTHIKLKFPIKKSVLPKIAT